MEWVARGGVLFERIGVLRLDSAARSDADTDLRIIVYGGFAFLCRGAGRYRSVYKLDSDGGMGDSMGDWYVVDSTSVNELFLDEFVFGRSIVCVGESVV